MFFRAFSKTRVIVCIDDSALCLKLTFSVVLRISHVRFCACVLGLGYIMHVLSWPVFILEVQHEHMSLYLHSFLRRSSIASAGLRR